MASDSMSARPMIIAVWIRAAAPGCRAIASTAAATARPWPRPQSPAANAIAKPATSTAYGPIHPRASPAAVAAVWAKASPGAARTAIAATISERRTRILLFCVCSAVCCDLLVMSRAVSVFRAVSVLGFLDRSRDVQHRQHDEDERLEERDQHLERVQEAHGEDDHHDPAH